MSATMGSRAPTCVLFNLPERRVLDAVDLPEGGRRMLVEHTAVEAGCPSCGTLSGRVHQRTRQHPRDVPITGPASSLEALLVKRHFACNEVDWARPTFLEVSDGLSLRTRVTTRLQVEVLDAVVGAGRVASEVAGAHSVAWWTVQKFVNAAADELADPDEVPVRRLGVDEQR